MPIKTILTGILLASSAYADCLPYTGCQTERSQARCAVASVTRVIGGPYLQLSVWQDCGGTPKRVTMLSQYQGADGNWRTMRRMDIPSTTNAAMDEYVSECGTDWRAVYVYINIWNKETGKLEATNFAYAKNSSVVK